MSQAGGLESRSNQRTFTLQRAAVNSKVVVIVRRLLTITGLPPVLQTGIGSILAQVERCGYRLVTGQNYGLTTAEEHVALDAGRDS